MNSDRVGNIVVKREKAGYLNFLSFDIFSPQKPPFSRSLLEETWSIRVAHTLNPFTMSSQAKDTEVVRTEQSGVTILGLRRCFHKQSLVFMAVHKKAFENIVGKGENAGNQHFLLLSQCFLPYQRPISSFKQHANASSLVNAEILSFGTHSMTDI